MCVERSIGFFQAFVPKMTMPNLFDVTLAKINSFSPYFQLALGMPDEPGWARAGALLADPYWTAAQLAKQHAKYSYKTFKNVATSFYDSYQWYVGAVAVGSFVADARVPDVGAHNIAVKFDDDGALSNIALITPNFACLPDDPAAGQPGVVTLADRDALRAHAARAIWEHVSQLIGPLQAAAGVSEQTLRRASVNSQAGLALWILQQVKQPALAVAEARAFGAALPFAAEVKLFEVECDGERETFLNGSVCCDWNLDPENASGAYCNNCPKVPMPKRMETLRVYMREKREQAA
jgi:hypothetical protein